MQHIVCNCCGADDTRPALTGRDLLHGIPGEFQLVRCNRCGLFYLNPQLTSHELEAYYPDDYEAHVGTQKQRLGWLRRLDYNYGIEKRYRAIMRFVETEYQGWLTLKDSPKPILRVRAEGFAEKMWRNRIFLLGIMHLAPTPEMADTAREILRRIEGSFGRATPLERSIARGLQVAGRIREARTRRWGDVIQPNSYVTYYNQ